MDPAYVKALYHKGRAMVELTDYAGAVGVLRAAGAGDPEVKKELARAETALKRYQDKE